MYSKCWQFECTINENVIEMTAVNENVIQSAQTPIDTFDNE